MRVPQYKESQRMGSAPDGRFSINGRAFDMASGREGWNAVAQAGALLRQTGEQAFGIAQDHLRDYNRTVALEKLNEAEKGMQALRQEQAGRLGKDALGTVDASFGEAGGMSGGSSGRAAMGVFGTVSDRVEALRTELSGGLNEAQRQYFEPAFQMWAAKLTGWAEQHETLQRKNWHTSVEDNRLKLEAGRALANVDNHQEFLAARGNMLAVLGVRGQREGWDQKAATAASNDTLRTSLYGPALDNLLERGNIAAAQGFVKQFGDDMGPEMVSRAAERIEARGKAVEAEAVFRRADDMAARMSKQVLAGDLESSQALQSIQGIKDKRERTATLKAWELYSRQAELALAEKMTAAQAGVYDAFEALSAKNDLPGMYRLLQDKEKAVLSNPKDKAAGAEYDRAKLLYAERVAKGTGVSHSSNPEDFNKASADIFDGRITTSEKLKSSYPGISGLDMKPLLQQIEKRDLDAGYARDRFRQLTLIDPPTSRLEGRQKQTHEALQKDILLRMYGWARDSGKGHDREAIDRFIVNELRSGILAGTAGAFSGVSGTSGTSGVSGTLEPDRPDDVPAKALWDQKRMAWVHEGRVRPHTFAQEQGRG